MVEIVRASRRELTLSEVLEVLNRGGRVLINDVILGEAAEMMLRKQGEIYYCDTPTKLFTHETEEEFKRCLVSFHLAAPDIEEIDESTKTPVTNA